MATRCIMGCKLLPSAQRPQPALERQGQRKTQRWSLDSRCLEPRATLECKTFSGTAQMSFYFWLHLVYWPMFIFFYIMISDCITRDGTLYSLRRSSYPSFNGNMHGMCKWVRLWLQFLHAADFSLVRIQIKLIYIVWLVFPVHSFGAALLQLFHGTISGAWVVHRQLVTIYGQAVATKPFLELSLGVIQRLSFSRFTHFQFGLVESHKMVLNVPIISNCDGVCFDV